MAMLLNPVPTLESSNCFLPGHDEQHQCGNKRILAQFWHAPGFRQVAYQSGSYSTSVSDYSRYLVCLKLVVEAKPVGNFLSILPKSSFGAARKIFWKSVTMYSVLIISKFFDSSTLLIEYALGWRSYFARSSICNQRSRKYGYLQLMPTFLGVTADYWF